MASIKSFKKHHINIYERLWLEEAARTGFSPRAALDRLKGRVPPDFRPDSIDSRLYAGNRIRPVGLWHVDSQHPALRLLDKVIRAIQARIPIEDVPVTITAAEVASATGEDERAAELAFQHLLDCGAGFFETAHGPASDGGIGYDRIEFSRGNLFDYYRKYNGMEDLLERAYTRVGKDLWGPEPNHKIASTKDATTRSEHLIERIQNHPVLAILIVIGISVIALGSFTEALVKISDAVKGLFDADDATQQSAEHAASSDDFQIVKVIPDWDANNVYWPMIPAEQEAFQAKQQAVMNECGFCISMTDHSAPAEDSVLNRAGSYVEFDARKCERVIRLAMKAFRLRRAVGVPPAMADVFGSVNLNPGMITQISTAEISTFSAAPVQCLE
jgi:hypothetical protein